MTAITFDPELGRRIALAYDALPRDLDSMSGPKRRRAFDSWRAMAADEVRLFTQATRRYCIRPWLGAGQPYSSSGDMREDVRVRRHLFVFTGGDPHPVRSADETYRGRAVHDIYAHALPGHSFSPDGELCAWLAQRELYCDEAQAALATDNLGPTAWYYFHPSNEGKPHAERRWPEQKFGLLPRELWEPLIV